MSKTYMTRSNEVGAGPFDSIRWAFESCIGEKDTGEFHYAVLHGNEDYPDKIELWRKEPKHDTPADRTWINPRAYSF